MMLMTLVAMMMPVKTARLRIFAMEKIHIQTNRFGLAFRFFIRCFIGVILVMAFRHGFLPPLVLAKSFMFSLFVSALAIFFPLKVMEIVIGMDQIKVPVKKGILFKSISLPISDIQMSERKLDSFLSSQIVTSDGLIVPVSSIYYSRKQKKQIIDEIKGRKNQSCLQG